MVRTGALVDLSSRLIDRGAIWTVDRLFGDLFQRPTKKGSSARLVKYVLFDAFLTGYAHVVAHEYGHSARLSEQGLAHEVLGDPGTRRWEDTRLRSRNAARLGFPCRDWRRRAVLISSLLF